MLEDEKQDKELNYIKISYFFLALAMLLFFLPYGFAMTMSFLLMMAGVILPYMRLEKVKTDFYKTHYRWLIRTFWLGNIIIIPLAVTTMFIVVFKYGDMTAFTDMSEMVMQGERMDELVAEFVKVNFKILAITILFTCIPAMIWWYGRLFIGYKKLLQSGKITNLKSWLF